MRLNRKCGVIHVLVAPADTTTNISTQITKSTPQSQSQPKNSTGARFITAATPGRPHRGPATLPRIICAGQAIYILYWKTKQRKNTSAVEIFASGVCDTSIARTRYGDVYLLYIYSVRAAPSDQAFREARAMPRKPLHTTF